MFPNPDPSQTLPPPLLPPSPAAGDRLRRSAVPASALILSVMLTSCSGLPWKSNRAEDEAVQQAILAAEARAVAQASAASAASSPVPPPAPPAPAPPPAPDPVARVLGYAERLRTMPPAELNQELARLAAPSEVNIPASQVQLSLVLSQLRQLPELIRGQELLARVLANAGPDAQPLHPLARLLAFRYGEQRRLEDQLEKERQQTREVQRKLDQTNERLEALKAIERSLTTRPPAPPAPVQVPAPAPASAPASRSRVAPP
jgi:hypothetical protein